ncbi:hypothetical protein ALC57_14801 [Trachymyrmex cornetzi]|uniref:Uncharacterized protein n=1 Tax=Trachymyrmex cornetzi TaxID=471704 RepID=A0A151IY42_9HYME|nr:hypothetical protein ALC57_14801 [Trachymyrmex cornetzi]
MLLSQELVNIHDFVNHLLQVTFLKYAGVCEESDVEMKSREDWQPANLPSDF